MPSVFKDPRFHDEQAAFAYVESIMWPNGKPEGCPHCGVGDRCNRLGVQTSKPSKRNPEGKPVYGLWKCYACRKQFTVRKGTIFEESRLELHIWLQAAFLMASSKKGISANQLHRTLGTTLKNSWFLAHRLREAMSLGGLNPFGLAGGAVEADEVYLTRKRRKGEGPRHKAKKMRVLTLIDRDTGAARSFVMDRVNAQTVAAVVRKNVSREARLMTDEAPYYNPIGSELASHETVIHRREQYARWQGERMITSNSVEGYFSLMKKGLKAVYQHVDEKHLHKYVSEYDFRYSHRKALGYDDQTRMEKLLAGGKGKRLTLRQPIHD